MPATPGSSEGTGMEPLEVLAYGFLEYQKGYGLSPATIKRNGYLVRRFCRWLGDRDIREADRAVIYQYFEYLKTTKSRRTGKPLSPQSIKLEMSVIKGFFDYLILQEKILAHPMEGMKIKRGCGKTIRKVFSEEDIFMFLDSIPMTTPEKQRDRAIFELMYSSGLRVGDIRGLEVEHLNIEERILIVRGKGKKDAYIPFSEVARRFLVLYLKDGRKKILKRMWKQKDKQYVFIAHKGKLAYDWLNKRFHNYLKACELDKKGYTMHSIRHATGTHLLAHGASIRYVQELLRHEDLKTTQLYTHPTVENIMAVYMTYHPRCNEYYKEVDKEYCLQVKELKERLLWGRKRSEQYRTHGHLKGFGKWKRSGRKKA